MPSVDEAFAIAIAHHQAGRLAQAEQIYRQILDLEPNHVAALHLLGVLASQVGQHDFAIQYIGKALELKPDFADAHNNLGNAFVNQGRLDEAVRAFHRALELRPDYPEAYYNLGNALLKQAALDEAASAFLRALELQPDLPDAHNNLGSVFRAQGKLDDAAACFRRVLQLKPDSADAQNNLGNVLLDQAKPLEAIACFQRALELKPDFADAHNNLGNAWMNQGKLDEAVRAFQRALELKPSYPQGHYNLGNALVKQGKLDEAVRAFLRALELKPDFADAHNNLGNAFRAQGKLNEANACFQRALELKPDLAEAHLNWSFLLLMQGDFEQGWPEYQWRLRTKSYNLRSLASFEQPLWDGQPLQGKTILLHAEQGLGDVLQFIRYASLVRERGGRVIVECSHALVPLLANCPSISRVLAEGEPCPLFDVQAPLLSLPGIFRTTLHDIPASIPYLFVQDEALTRWPRELVNDREFKIGLVWQGNPQNPVDLARSIRLREFAPLLQLPKLKFYSLQKGAGPEQLPEFSDQELITDLSLRLSDFQETAAAIKNLDLVISCDTAVAHLAGGLRAPVWMAIPFAPDWRWLLGRDDSPWYPTMRLFRQREPGNWSEVFERMSDALRELTS